MAGSFQLLPPTRGLQDQGWEPLASGCALVGVPALSLGGSLWLCSPMGRPAVRVSLPASRQQGPEEMDAHVEIWGCLYTGKMRRAGKPPACVSGVRVGPPSPEPAAKRRAGSKPPFAWAVPAGCQEEPWHGSAAPARPLLQTSSCSGRFSSTAAHACGGEHSLLRLGNSSAFCACKILELFCRVHKKTPTIKAGCFLPLLSPFRFRVAQ